MEAQETSSCVGTLGFIGFGEAGMAFATGLLGDGYDKRTGDIVAFDIKTARGGNSSARKLSDYKRAGVFAADDAQSCVSASQVIFSMVTADEALNAALSAAPGIERNRFYLDCNSCAPDTKKQAAAASSPAGGRYVDVAIMAPVHPDLHKTPVLVSGDWAPEALALLTSLGMRASLVPGGVGAAASIKLIRSVMVKGLEALLAECLLAGTKAGVTDQVLSSLEETYLEIDWKQRSDYALLRMMKHGLRRAAEMDEATLCLKSFRISSPMAQATAKWQRAIGELNLCQNESSGLSSADQILAALKAPKPTEN